MDCYLTGLTACDLVRMIRSRRVSVREVVSDCLDHTAAIDGVVRAWAWLDRDSALRRADAIDDRIARGEDVGALAGVPVGVKDVFNTADMPTQMGSPIWSGFMPGNDARVVYSLRMAGAVIPGKTVTAEFAVHTPGETTNPHDPDFMTGTSSSGSAAAVAACMVPVALGTQTAGSTIRPASYNGVYGFKPSFGLIPRTGMLKTTDSLDTVGFFARDVADLELVFEVLRVHGLDYPISHAALSDPARQVRGARPWRVALVRGPKWEYAEPYAQQALLDLARSVAGLTDIVVEPVDLDREFERAHEIHAAIYDRALAYYFRAEYEKRSLISETMYHLIEHGNRVTLDEYLGALDGQADLARRLDDLLADRYDAILTLSTGGEPLRGHDSVDRPDTCLIWTMCYAPTIHLPVFTGPNRMPYGVQIVGRRYNDYRLLSLARHLREVGVAPAAPYPVPPCAERAAAANFGAAEVAA